MICPSAEKSLQLISVAELEYLTKDEWGIHLFAEAADQQMAKVAMELLATKDPKILDIKKKIKELHLVHRAQQ